MISVEELRNLADSLNITQINVIEKDWVLGHIINQIFSSQLFSSSLVFKGGTSLRKCWFSNYRFSEDLDFTILGPNLNSVSELEEQIDSIKHNLHDIGIRIGTSELRQTLNTKNERAFIVKLPYQAVLPVSAILPKINLDLSSYEKMIYPITQKNIIHNFSDSSIITNQVVSYSIEEILIEKMRTILQRFYPRDLYDVYYILSYSAFDPLEIKNSFLEKCNYKNVPFSSVNDFFDKVRLDNARNAWNKSLSHLIKNLPDFDMVIGVLNKSLTSLLK